MSSRVVVCSFFLLAIGRVTQLLRDVAIAAAAHSLVAHIALALLIWALVMVLWAMMHWSRVEPAFLRLLSLPGEIRQEIRDSRSREPCESALPRAQQYNADADYAQACLTLLRTRNLPSQRDIVIFIRCLQKSRDGMCLQSSLPQETIDELERYIDMLWRGREIRDSIKYSKQSQQTRAEHVAYITEMHKQRSRLETLLSRALEQQAASSGNEQPSDTI